VNDITLVLGIDAKTVEQLKVSWPTWLANRDSMWDWPWVVFYDRDQLTCEAVLDLVDAMGKGPEVTLVPWPPPGCDPPYDSQRERMLSGHVFVPATWVRTAWYMKLDTDALARPHPKWIDPEWFKVSPSYRPVYVAPRWGYTKGVGFLDRLEDWCDWVHGGLEAPTPRLNIPHEPDQVRVGHARMCSWCSYYRTDFAKQVAKLCDSLLPKFTLPVPSQDTTMWYVAARYRLTHRIENMKKLGWSNHSRIDELRRTAAEILTAEK
jgi:hypothetical protein